MAFHWVEIIPPFLTGDSGWLGGGGKNTLIHKSDLPLELIWLHVSVGYSASGELIMDVTQPTEVVTQSRQRD